MSAALDGLAAAYAAAQQPGVSRGNAENPDAVQPEQQDEIAPVVEEDDDMLADAQQEGALGNAVQEMTARAQRLTIVPPVKEPRPPKFVDLPALTVSWLKKQDLTIEQGTRLFEISINNALLGSGYSIDSPKFAMHRVAGASPAAVDEASAVQRAGPDGRLHSIHQVAQGVFDAQLWRGAATAGDGRATQDALR